MEEVLNTKNQKRKLEDEKESDSKKQKIEKENSLKESLEIEEEENECETQTSITRLSFEVTCLILRLLAEYVDAGTYFRLSQLCKKTYEDLKIDDERWKRKYVQFWPFTNPKLQNDSVDWHKLALQRSSLEYPRLALFSILQSMTDNEILYQFEKRLDIFRAAIRMNKYKEGFFKDFDDVEDLRLLNSVHLLKINEVDTRDYKKVEWEVNYIIYGPSGVPTYFEIYFKLDWENDRHGSFSVRFSPTDDISDYHRILEIIFDGKIDIKNLIESGWNFGNYFLQHFGSTYEDGVQVTCESLKKILFHSFDFSTGMSDYF